MKAIVTHWPNLLDTSGQTVETEWEALFDRFERGGEFHGDREHPGWSAARFDPPTREGENVRQVTAVVLDYDGAETIQGAMNLWSGTFGFLHTTRKHTAEAPRFRVILPLARPVSPFEYAAIWRRVNARAGGKLDPAPKDPGRFWFTPGGGEFVSYRLAGEPLDPDAILAMPEPPSRHAAPVIPIHTARDEYARNERRASSYVAKMPPGISGQGGHAATWAAALAAAQGFGLDVEATYRILCEFNARCEPPWTERELRHKAHDAVEKARVPSGYKLTDDRRYEPPPEHYGAADDEPPEWLPQESEDDDVERAAIAEEGTAPAPKRTAAQKAGLLSIGDLLDAVVKLARTNVKVRGVTTGNFQLDEALGGLRRQKIAILGAETSFGKSSFAIMVADEAIRAGARVLIVTGEDGAEMYGQRFMSRRARVNASRIRDNDLRQEDIDKMELAALQAERTPFFIDGIGKPAEQLAHIVLSVCKEEDVQLVIVDYLQALTCAKRCQDRRVEITHIARTLSDAIKQGNAAGLLLSQLKRPENSTKPPTMHDLKESGDLENMAEHVLLGHLEVHEPPGGTRTEKHMFHLAKNKDGSRYIERVHIPFDYVTASFRTTNGETQNQYTSQTEYGEYEDR
jgi:KaiC/GvpD/RAD55 family RecA-like ATPase